ncbi:MAG: nucleotidyltransferase domain-containing protein [Candidatus Aenigmarchaeota archaeon]|nr:nucleotidyltransferase domain-containing protein [Candidatus Aenigmarchaeota archaeon]
MPLETLEDELEEVVLAKRKEEKKDAEEPRPISNKEMMAKVIKFTNEARQQYSELIKSVLIFGSAVRGDATKGSDVDLFVVIDDTATKSSEDLQKVTSHLHLIANELKDLHVQTHTLTEFWQWIKVGSPELVNFLRYGLTIYDTGFIKPVQRMLNMGLIPPSEETIILKARTADTRYKAVVRDIKSMIFDLRYSVLDIIQAVVMHYYKAQPDYKKAPEYMEKLVKEKMLEKEYIDKFKELDSLWKKIDHKEIKDATPHHLETALQLARDLITRFRAMIPKEIIGEEIRLEE